MTTPRDLYVQGIHHKLDYFATWLPGRTLTLGDFGPLVDGALDYKGRLADQHVAFDERVDRNPVDYSHTSDAGVRIDIKAAAATAVPAIKGKAAVHFAQRGAFVFHATGCVGHAIADQVDLEAQLRAAHEQGRWDLDWVVVTEVVWAERATILIANSVGAQVDLSVQGDLAAAVRNLASAEAGVALEAQSGDVTQVIAATGLTPLYRLARLKKRWFSSDVSLGTVRSAGVGPLEAATERGAWQPEPAAAPEVKLEPLTLADLQPASAGAAVGSRGFGGG